jgi:effector-binding domain-containing protein
MLDGVWAFLRQGDLRTDGHNVMVYRGDVPNMEFEVGVVVSRDFEANGAVVPSNLPSGRAAHTIHIGDYSGLGGAHEAVARWCRAHDHTPSGTRWEVYGDWDPDPTRVQTDLYWLLQD